jgi:predicted Zn-dependent protease
MPESPEIALGTTFDIAAQAGRSILQLAQRSPLGKNAQSYWRLINAQYPQGEPAAGNTHKIIE